MKKKKIGRRNRFSIDYEAVETEQGGVCAICKQPPKEGGNRLHMDHDHKFHKIKVYTKQIEKRGLWYAFAEWPEKEGKPPKHIRRFLRYLYRYPAYVQVGWKRRATAKKKLQRLIRNASFRGLLCWFCNTALQKFRDNAFRMENAAIYIRTYRGALWKSLEPK